MSRDGFYAECPDCGYDEPNCQCDDEFPEDYDCTHLARAVELVEAERRPHGGEALQSTEGMRPSVA